MPWRMCSQAGTAARITLHKQLQCVTHHVSLVATFSSAVSPLHFKVLPREVLPPGQKHRSLPETARPTVLEARKTRAWSYVPETEDMRHSPPSSAAIQARERLSQAHERPIDVLRSSLMSEPDAMDIVLICLDEHYERLMTLATSERSAYVQTQPIAATIINYLLENDRAWLEFVMDLKGAARRLCYSALAEGLEEILVDWTRVDIDQSKAEKIIGQNQYAWRGIFFRSIIEAQLLHARDGSVEGSASADSSLKLFFDMIEARSHAFALLPRDSNGANPRDSSGGFIGPQWIAISPRPALLKLQNTLSRPGWSGTTPALYNRFLAFSERYVTKATENDKELAVARLHLHHPSAPNVKPAIALFKRLFAEKTAREILASLPPTPAFHVLFEQCVKSTVAMAAAKGLRKDALWLERVLMEIFPPRRKDFSSGTRYRSEKPPVSKGGSTDGQR